MPKCNFFVFIMNLFLLEIFYLDLCLDLHLNAWFKFQMFLECACRSLKLVLGQRRGMSELRCKSLVARKCYCW
jgi:hypothetical protein